MEGSPVSGLRAVVFDFPKTICDARDCVAASWHSLMAQFPVFRGIPMDRLAKAASVGQQHIHETERTLSQFVSGQSRRTYILHTMWRRVYAELDLPSYPSVDEALRLDAVRTEAVNNCRSHMDHTTDTLETVRQLGISVGLYANTAEYTRETLSDMLAMPDMTDFGIFANCSQRDRPDFQELEDVVLDNLPPGDLCVDDVQSHEILFVGAEGSAEMRDARAAGLQTLVWDPQAPNSDESAADMQNVLRVVMERNNTLQEMQL